MDTTIGALTGFIPGIKIRGITVGRGNYNSIFKQMVTKFNDFSIDRVTAITAGKMFVGRAAHTGMIPGTGIGVLSTDYRSKIGQQVKQCH